jgi:hypothetical protein
MKRGIGASFQTSEPGIIKVEVASGLGREVRAELKFAKLINLRLMMSTASQQQHRMSRAKDNQFLWFTLV